MSSETKYNELKYAKMLHRADGKYRVKWQLSVGLSPLACVHVVIWFIVDIKICILAALNYFLSICENIKEDILYHCHANSVGTVLWVKC